MKSPLRKQCLKAMESSFTLKEIKKSGKDFEIWGYSHYFDYRGCGMVPAFYISAWDGNIYFSGNESRPMT